MTSLYHRLPRDHPRFTHWRLPVAGIIAVAGYLGAAVVLFGVVVAGFEIAGEGDRVDAWMDSLELSGLGDPIFLGVDLGGIAILLPVVLLALLATGRHQVGLLLSVEGRMRWRWLALTSALAFVVVAGVFLASLLVLPVDVVGARPDVRLPDGTMVVGLVVVLLLVPFQAAAEEVVCRGYLVQLIGSWIPKVWLGALVGGVVGTALFVLGHAYELWGQVDVGLFGVVCVVLTLRTGGLEAAIALHAANNIVLFAFDGFAVWPDVTSSDADGPLYVLPTVIIALIFIGLVELMAARGGLARRREWPVLPPPRPRPVWGPVGVPAPSPYPATWSVGSIRPEVSPGTPTYPGELPEGWNR